MQWINKTQLCLLPHYNFGHKISRISRRYLNSADSILEIPGVSGGPIQLEVQYPPIFLSQNGQNVMCSFYTDELVEVWEMTHRSLAPITISHSKMIKMKLCSICAGISFSVARLIVFLPDTDDCPLKVSCQTHDDPQI